MPIFTIELPDGTETEINAPEGATNQQAIAYAKKLYDEGYIGQKRYGAMEGIIGGTQAIGSVASGLLAEPVAGLRGLFELATGGSAEEATKQIESTREALTYQPRTPAGRTGLRNIGKMVGPYAELLAAPGEFLGEQAFEATESPFAATAARLLPETVASAFGLYGLRGLQPPKQALTPRGEPTPEFRKALEKEGIVWESLPEETKAAISPEITPAGLGGGFGPIAQDIAVGELAGGSRAVGLAEKQLREGPLAAISPITKDPLASEALRQGFKPNFVQSVRQTTPTTKKLMEDMLQIRRKISDNQSYAQVSRPIDVVGGPLQKRLEILEDVRKTEGKKLGEIVKTKLKGLPVDTTRPQNFLKNIQDEYNFSVTFGEKGPEFDFSKSRFMANPAAMNSIRKMYNIYYQDLKKDAARLHEMKNQVDEHINFASKKSPTGKMDETAENLLKQFRSEVNNAVREVSPEYAQVNQSLQSAIGPLNTFYDAFGNKLRLLKGEDLKKAIAQESRKLQTNYNSRLFIEDATKAVDDAVSGFGYKFDENAYDLVNFANTLDDMFGAAAPGSMKGISQTSIEPLMRGDLKGAAMERIAGTAAEKIQNLRGINESGAFNALDALLKRKY